MAKPLGIVAMLTLLISSGTALADHHFPIKAIDDIKVTNTNKIHFELRNGETVTGVLPNCDVMSFVEQTGAENLGLYAHGAKMVKNGSKITFLNLGEKRLRKRAIGSCQVDNLGGTDDSILLAQT